VITALTGKQRLLIVLAGIFIGIYFFAFTGDALRFYFSPDDLMNLYRSWANPAGRLLRANLLFFLNSVFYRPFAAVWYRSIFDVAGFNPIPFHIFNLCILVANVWLTYAVARRLTKSREVGITAAFLISYHGQFASLYFDTGFIFDVLCYFFYFATFLYYLRVRSQFTAQGLIVLALLYVCAVNSKEMALTMPAILFAYEWLYRWRGWGQPVKWATVQGKGVLLTGVLTVAVAIGRVTTGNALISQPVYRPVFSLTRFLETTKGFVSALFFGVDVPVALVALIWISLFIIAWGVRSRALKFSWLFLTITPLPIAFISPRGPAQYYITYFGWVLYFATALRDATTRLFRNLPANRILVPIRPVLVFLVIAGYMYMGNRPYTWSKVTAIASEGDELRIITEQIHRLRPKLPRHARVLFLNDPMEDRYRMIFLMRLSYEDRYLTIDQAKFMDHTLAPNELASYHTVFDYRHGQFRTSIGGSTLEAQPEIVYEWRRPGCYHGNWNPIRQDDPARRGESIICVMADLGETRPVVPRGQPFPTNPFAEVDTPLEVRVDGTLAEIKLKIGWPERVNQYRVDIRVPENIRTGEAKVVVTSGGHTGEPTPLPIQ
jgi:uncharacterized membrane protein YecN with MAPEG domain